MLLLRFAMLFCYVFWVNPKMLALSRKTWIVLGVFLEGRDPLFGMFGHGCVLFCLVLASEK